MKRDFLSLADVKREELFELLRLTAKVKKTPHGDQLAGKTFALLFFKPSTRTRVSFEVGIKQLGGETVYLDRTTTQLVRGETVEDTARVLTRYVDGIIARVYGHETLRLMANQATVPVINALSDLCHPCQALADLFTIRQFVGKFEGVKLAYVGDGNNVCNSLIMASAMAGLNISIACPPGYEPNKQIVDRARRIAESQIEIVPNPAKAVEGARVIYTDVWVSIGMEAEQAERLRVFRPYQVNAQLVRRADPDFIFMHCLPCHRGQEVTGEIIDGPHSVVFEQAENRLHTAKALLIFLTR
jgi:ornithine carbamoyltransferase